MHSSTMQWPPTSVSLMISPWCQASFLMLHQSISNGERRGIRGGGGLGVGGAGRL